MKMKYKSLSLLGSTGSIGRQTLEILADIAPETELEYLTCYNNIDLLERQAVQYHPKRIVVGNEKSYADFKRTTRFTGEILAGDEGITAAATCSADVVVSALVGFAGIMPTYHAVKAGKIVALSNKESLVAAGAVITALAKETGAKLLPVDSEHSAVLQSLVGEQSENIEKIILTASGGPFRNLPAEKFENITVEQALNHPNWSMGNKITVDSATMMNKGFEIIEAMWLFDVPPEKIDVLIHPESIIHSMVQYSDGSVKAQLGLPDMRLPICYALTYPERTLTHLSRLDLAEIAILTFSKPDRQKFKCLDLAQRAMQRGGNAGAVLNAANDMTVRAFLDRKINFTDIPDIVDEALNTISFIPYPSINDVILTIDETKKFLNQMKKLENK